MSKTDMGYQVYSEFKESNWYIYWDKEFSRNKKYQRLIVWHISENEEVPYDYISLKGLFEKGKPENGLPYVQKLSKSDIDEFLKICHEFCADVELEFGTKD